MEHWILEVIKKRWEQLKAWIAHKKQLPAPYAVTYLSRCQRRVTTMRVLI